MGRQNMLVQLALAMALAAAVTAVPAEYNACGAVVCLVPTCDNPLPPPPGECCYSCPASPVDCSAVSCPIPDCDKPLPPPPGGCCSSCPDGSPSLSDQCPKIRTGSFGACIFKCSDDDDCQLGQICCSNGCGQACICPPDKPLVNCFVDPCDVTICPAHPDAMCQADYCGGCNARFLDSDGDEVTETCNRMF